MNTVDNDPRGQSMDPALPMCGGIEDVPEARQPGEAEIVQAALVRCDCLRSDRISAQAVREALGGRRVVTMARIIRALMSAGWRHAPDARWVRP